MNSVRAPYDLTEAAHDYPAWHGPPRRTVLICTHPRSGSTLLGEALYFAGGLGCPLEYFHSGFRPGLAARWRAPALVDYIRAAHRWRTDPDGTFAAKLFWPDLVQLAGERAPGDHSALDTMPPEAVPPATYRAIGAQLAAIFPNPRFVYLERRDRVRLAISGMAALHSGRWRVVAAADAPAAAI
jgi:LPS sulfotransferase NodH